MKSGLKNQAVDLPMRHRTDSVRIKDRVQSEQRWILSTDNKLLPHNPPEHSKETLQSGAAQIIWCFVPSLTLCSCRTFMPVSLEVNKAIHSICQRGQLSAECVSCF